MPPLVFLVLTTVGSALWVIVLVALGFGLNTHYQRVSEFVDPVANAIIALFAIAYIYRLITYKPER